MIARPFWTLQFLEQYVEIALETMAKAGLVRADAEGQPLCEGKRAWRADDGSACVELMADLSVMGLTAAVPITVTTFGDESVIWKLGSVPMATISADWMPE